MKRKINTGKKYTMLFYVTFELLLEIMESKETGGPRHRTGRKVGTFWIGNNNHWWKIKENQGYQITCYSHAEDVDNHANIFFCPWRHIS